MHGFIVDLDFAKASSYSMLKVKSPKSEQNARTACPLGQSILDLLALFGVFDMLPVVIFGSCSWHHVVN